MKYIISLTTFCLGGSLILTAFSFIQKTAIGVNPFLIRCYVVPILLGGLSGCLIGVFRFRQKRIIEALRDSERQYRNLYEEAPHAYFSVGVDGRIKMVNRQAGKLLGCSREDLLGRRLLDLYADTPAGKVKAEQIFNRFRAGEKIIGQELEMCRADGNPAWIHLTIRPVRGVDGTVVQSCSMAVDTTNLKKTERELKQSEEKFRTLFGSANDAIFLMKGDLFIDCNPPTEILFGCAIDLIIGQAPHRFSPEIQPDGRNSRKTALEKITAALEGKPQVFEWRHSRLDGSLVDTEVSLNRLELSGEVLLMAIVRDITEHSRSKKEIQNQLAEISSYYDNAPIGLAVLDLDLRFVRINSMLADINGIPAADHVGKSAKEIVPGLEDTVQKITAEILKTGKPVTDMELVGETASQPGINRFWLESWYPIVDDAHKITGFSVIIKEITERKRAREEIEKVNQQLRSLSSHLLDTLEKERLSIAREIHDDFGQTLSALKMDINWVRKRLHPDQRSVMDKLGTMTSIVNQSVQSVKRICTKLRPAVLDDLGLSDALEWYTAQFQEQTGIRCSLDTETAAMKVNSHIKTAVFRICQEALTNVRRHSKATSVDISLKFTGNWITLEIKDNGKGISHFALIRSKAFGVVGMRERVHAFGGDFDISGQPGVGTCIRVVIPLPN